MDALMNEDVKKVMAWALPELTEEEDRKMKLEIDDILKKVYAESDLAIAAEEAKLHETCPTCGHITKTYKKP
jgi:Asp-tRNA(Asn)/Glu-tRNA(Gln) amidotransferase C subunit